MKLHTLKDFELACGNTIVEFGYCPPHIAECCLGDMMEKLN